MPTRPADAPLARAFRLAYGLGLALCVGWPLVLQLLLGTAIRRPADLPPGDTVAQLGYTFTGLTFAAAAFVTWRWGRTRRAFRTLEPAQRPRRILRETLAYAALFELSACYGLVYYALGGPGAERHARAFIALASVMFFVFVPRFDAWREAAEEEQP